MVFFKKRLFAILIIRQGILFPGWIEQLGVVIFYLPSINTTYHTGLLKK
jgi:hypothetical protein